MTIKTTGVFPLGVTAPVCSHTRFIIVNSVHTSMKASSDLFGLDILKAAHLAYPYAVQAMHCVSALDSQSTAPDLPDGINKLLPGRISLATVVDLLTNASATPHPLFGTSATSRKIYICGPRSYEVHIVDLLSEAGVAFNEMQMYVAAWFLKRAKMSLHTHIQFPIRYCRLPPNMYV